LTPTPNNQKLAQKQTAKAGPPEAQAVPLLAGNGTGIYKQRAVGDTTKSRCLSATTLPTLYSQQIVKAADAQLA
jgi:hypothetical protein